MESTDARWDFFISYTQADRAWAEWIAWTLEEDGHRVLVQAWDFVPGGNWTQSMQDGVTRSDRTIAVLSDAYLGSRYGAAELQAAWREDPLGEQRKLLPVRVMDCNRPGLLGGVVSIDIFGLDEAQAEAELRHAITAALTGRVKPATRPAFPAARAIPQQARFPGAMPTVWNVPARNPNFTGRDEELDAIGRALTAGSTVTVHSLHGLGGVGKTQLAIEYAYTYAGRYDLVWLIAAEEATTIPDQFTVLARRLGLDPPADPDEVRYQVHEALRSKAGWLLIFDNANNADDIRPWQPSIPLPAGIPGHVIVTTRRGGFLSLGGVLDLDVLDMPAAVRVLRSRVPDLDQNLAEGIAKILGRLPLALEQAAAFLDRTQMRPAEYLRLLNARPDAVLTEGEVSTVWKLSLDRVHTDDPAALQLLDISAYLAPESIPEDLFTNHPDQLPEPLATTVTDPLAFNESIATLVDYSLVKRTATGLQVHRLIQAAVRARHKVS